MAFGTHPKSVGVHREIRHVETLVLVCGNNKKSPISSTKLHKIKTAEPILRMSRRILSFAQRAIGPCPIQLVVVMAVRKAVRAATITFTATSTIRFVFITFTFQSSKFNVLVLPQVVTALVR